MLHFSHLTKYLNISQFILRKVNERIQMYMLKKKTNICQRNILLLNKYAIFPTDGENLLDVLNVHIYIRRYTADKTC